MRPLHWCDHCHVDAYLLVPSPQTILNKFTAHRRPNAPFAEQRQSELSDLIKDERVINSTADKPIMASYEQRVFIDV